MNAVVQFQPQQAAPAQSFTMSEMERVALAIAKGGLFGSTDPNAVLTLCMVAQAEGKHPGLVMQQYHLINGKPAKKAEAMLVDFLASGGRVQWHTLDDSEADATFTHPAGGEARISWDMARAKKAGLTTAMWTKYPRQMLRSRVVSEGVRTVFPGATSGMYVPEEIMDMEPERKGPAAPQATRARDLKRIEAAPQDSPGRAKAEEWVGNQVAAVENASDVEALDAIIAGGNKAVAKLAREHADLHGKVTAAYEAKAQELNGYDSGTGEVAEPEHPFLAYFTAKLATAETPAELDALNAEIDAQDLPADVADALRGRVAEKLSS